MTASILMIVSFPFMIITGIVKWDEFGTPSTPHSDIPNITIFAVVKN